MKNFFVAAMALAFGVSSGGFAATQTADVPPPWAWGFLTPPDNSKPAVTPAPAATPARDDTKRTIPGSKFSFTRAEISNRYGPADWFPEDHPALPDIVAHGRESASPQIYACGLCHLPTGKGRPENANLTGLPYDYIVRQLSDFREGLRRTSDPRKTNTSVMESFTRALTDADIKAAATYFSSLPATPWVKVVESTTAPKTRPQGGVFLTITGSGAGTEPLGNRIVETPINAEDFEILRNPRSGFIAYVPPGSIAKGKALVTTGGGKATPCIVCHGVDLRGLGPVPRLAGTSPSYVVRQLYDMQHGNRVGAWSPLMAPVIEKLSADDLIVIAAYLASLEP